MRIKETKFYQFRELSEEAKEKAVENLADINVNYEWWYCFMDDAAQIGLKIEEFDIGRGNFCRGQFTESAEYTAEKILNEHGKSCDTYQTAKNYLENRTELVKKYSDGRQLDIVAEDNEYDFDNDCDELDNEFLRSILEDYRIYLQKEYEYLTSEKTIIETIEANYYEFTEDGKLE